ncbi:MAG: macro domain-containing protein [Patescibacteria group bacterium]
MARIEIVQGDICEQRTDALVNAANTELLHGGGVAAAIVHAGGSAIQEESNAIAPIPLGEAAVTGAGKLKVKFIIHAATMELGSLASSQTVSAALENSFKRAIELGIASVALPALGAGTGGFPKDACAELSIAAALRFGGTLRNIVFVLRDPETFKHFQDVHRAKAGKPLSNNNQK